MKTKFAPGCAMFINDPALNTKAAEYLKTRYGVTEIYDRCCHKKPDEPLRLVCVCSGCIRRYDQLYDGVSAVSMWEMIDSDENFSFPDYKGKKMAVLDACPTRKYENLHRTVRSLLKKMNIVPVEPEQTGTGGKCCGDSFYGTIPKESVLKKMKERADEMPADEVAVYCVSCIKSVRNGGKIPAHMLALLFNTATAEGECDPDIWHGEIERFAKEHG